MPRKYVPKVRICEFCGHQFGKERGPAAKTCSEECQRDRNNAREKLRYQRVKDSDEWKEARADYLQRLSARLAADPGLAERLRARHLEAARRWREKLEQDEARFEEYKAKKRAWAVLWIAAMSPEQRENRRAKNRAWYAQLTPEQRQMFFYDLHAQRAKQRIEDLANK